MIKDADKPKAWFVVPKYGIMPPGTGTIHIIIAVTDSGTPRLTRYKRVIVTVTPTKQCLYRGATVQANFKV